MTAIRDHIRSLQRFAAGMGARLVLTTLPEGIHGRVTVNVIAVSPGLSPQEELCALVHEIAHWLVHRDVWADFTCTVFEYEAEAVEAVVMERLGFSPRLELAEFGCDDPTDGLTVASVRRVRWAADRITEALRSDSKAPVDVEAAAGEEVVLEYEEHRVRDFLGLTQAL
jgi:hypothetical protein